MPVGLQVINNNNKIQIDENYKNLVLRGKGSSVASTAHYKGFRVDVVLTANTPMLAWKVSGTAKAAILNVKKSGNQYTYRFWATAQVTIQWYLFDVASEVAATNYGFEVFNSVGERVYSSNQRPLRVVDVVNQRLDYTQSPDRTISVPTGKNYAVIQGPLCFDHQIYEIWGGGLAESIETFDLFSAGFTINQIQFSLSNMIDKLYSYSYYFSAYQGQIMYIIVDVTNY